MESINASGEVHVAYFLADLLEERIEQIGKTRWFKLSLIMVLTTRQQSSF